MSCVNELNKKILSIYLDSKDIIFKKFWLPIIPSKKTVASLFCKNSEKLPLRSTMINGSFTNKCYLKYKSYEIITKCDWINGIAVFVPISSYYLLIASQLATSELVVVASSSQLLLAYACSLHENQIRQLVPISQKLALHMQLVTFYYKQLFDTIS